MSNKQKTIKSFFTIDHNCTKPKPNLHPSSLEIFVMCMNRNQFEYHQINSGNVEKLLIDDNFITKYIYNAIIVLQKCILVKMYPHSKSFSHYKQ